MSKTQSHYLNKCHCLLKRMVYVCKDSPKFIYDLLSITKPSHKGDRIITCTLDYLHFVSFYKKETLLSMKKQVLSILSIVQSNCKENERDQLAELTKVFNEVYGEKSWKSVYYLVCSLVIIILFLMCCYFLIIVLS